MAVDNPQVGPVGLLVIPDEMVANPFSLGEKRDRTSHNHARIDLNEYLRYSPANYDR